MLFRLIIKTGVDLLFIYVIKVRFKTVSKEVEDHITRSNEISSLYRIRVTSKKD